MFGIIMFMFGLMFKGAIISCDQHIIPTNVLKLKTSEKKTPY